MNEHPTWPCPPPEGCDDVTENTVSDVDSFDIFEAASRRADEQMAAIEHNSRGTCCRSCGEEIARDRARVGEEYGR